MENQYSANDVRTMQLANDARLPGKNRVEELKKYALLAGYKRLGIAHCVAFQKEAEQLKESLSESFEVYTVDCKCGKIPASEFLGSDARGVSCNPAGQALYLDRNKTEMNIVMGLCVGHDMVFSAHSKVPATTLIVKDREHRHNPLEIFRKED